MKDENGLFIGLYSPKYTQAPDLKFDVGIERPAAERQAEETPLEENAFLSAD